MSHLRLQSDENLLAELFTKYGTDKGIWGYAPFYAALMGPARFHVRRVLEVGICGYRDIPNNVVGASLFVWRDFFPNATVYGVDIDGRFIFNNQERIRTAQVDAYDPDALHNVLVHFARPGVLDGRFDMIVDDAVHDPAPQIQLMNQLGNWMLPGGHYFMEDVGPYKLPNEDLFGITSKIDGFTGVSVGALPEKPEALIIGVK
jgi:hypothetical protein